MSTTKIWQGLLYINKVKNYDPGNFPGGLMAKSLCSQCRRGPEFDPWLGNQIPHAANKDPAYSN